MASTFKSLSDLERKRRQFELDYESRMNRPGTPEYASASLAALPGGVELAAMSGLPIVSDAADVALTAEAAQEGRWGDAAIRAAAAALPFLSAPMIRKGLDALERRAGPTPTLPVEQMSTDALMSGIAQQLPGQGQTSIPVYHGTPHKWQPESDFPQGRPRLDKIGTGEGAQAYGHGIYFAEKPGVAKSYRDALAQDTSLDGVSLGNSLVAKKDLPPGAYDAVRIYASNEGDLSKSIEELKWQQKVMPAIAEGAQQGIDWLKANAEKLSYNPGSMYSLDLPDEVLPRLLDWDAPLGGQSDEVRKAIDTAAKAVNPTPKWWQETDISGVPKALLDIAYQKKINTHPVGVSPLKARTKGLIETVDVQDLFRGLGVPGLRYFDAMSRTPGQGTRNFVIWDQDLLNRMPILGVE